MNDSKQSMLKKYIRFMDKFEIPWAPVFGNHDYNVDATMDRQCELYESSKYCIFKKGTVQNSYGNYYYNIERNGTPVYTLFFMDNGISFTDAHLDWYANSINAIAEENGGVEGRTAFQAAEAGDPVALEDFSRLPQASVKYPVKAPRSGWIGHMDAEKVGGLFSDMGIALRSGLHCAPLAHRTLKTPPSGAVRVSFGWFNTHADVLRFYRTLRQILTTVR